MLDYETFVTFSLVQLNLEASGVDKMSLLTPLWTCPEGSQTYGSSRKERAAPPSPPPPPFKRLPGNISRLKRCIFQNVNKKLHILVLASVKVTLLLFYEQERRVAR